MRSMIKLKSWLAAERGRGVGLAAVLGVPPSFVTKMGSGEKSIPIEHMAAIESFTDGEVTRQEMHPTGWHRIWPELVTNSEQKQPSSLDGQAVSAPETVNGENAGKEAHRA